ncbi:MAG: glutathione synthase [gamma proteobacterium symbiont of Bathyaustriella thionipta]|nr:glutathione synthase [gamma proteobacterium symbiont of Bathyaustriella thionipta]
MNINIGIIMDPIADIKIHKDSSFAMLLEAQQRGWRLFYMQQDDLFQRDQDVCASAQRLRVCDNPQDWFSLESKVEIQLARMDVILMRKDPPFDMEYLYTTYLLQRIANTGVLVVNNPAALRDANEKLAATWFPAYTPPTLISRQTGRFVDFIDQYRDVIVKPLDGMGGESIFRVRADDPNRNVILETITRHGQRSVMAQTYIPEISAGDKRVLIVDGQPVPYALARIPREGELRGNLARGATGQGQALSTRDQEIAEQVGAVLKERGVLFAGLDIIGDYLTEVNITSPTCIRELDSQFNLNISGQLLDAIENRLNG